MSNNEGQATMAGVAAGGGPTEADTGGGGGLPADRE